MMHMLCYTNPALITVSSLGRSQLRTCKKAALHNWLNTVKFDCCSADDSNIEVLADYTLVKRLTSLRLSLSLRIQSL